MARSANGRTVEAKNPDFQVPQVTTVKLKDVEVPAFQRGLSEKWAKEIADNWNPLLFRPPLLSRRADGKLDIIDGQHTIRAVRLRGHDEVPALVRDGMDEETEARTFGRLNTDRKGLRPYEVWKAEAMGGVQWAVALDTIAKKHGLKVAHERGPNALACIGECRRILRKENGAELLDWALYVLTHAWDDVADEANSTRIERVLVAGMVDLIEHVSPKGLFDADGWVEKLRHATFKVGQNGQALEVNITPRVWPSYVSHLLEKGKLQLSALQTGSGQGALHGRALAIAILGDRRTNAIYR